MLTRIYFITKIISRNYLKIMSLINPDIKYCKLLGGSRKSLFCKNNLSTFTTDTTGKLDVFGHDGHPL